jgi:uncharacterized membrane protein
MVSATSISRAVQLGVSTGVRSMTPIALVSRAGVADAIHLPADTPFALLARKDVANTLTAFAILEILADKTLNLPRRGSPVPLVARMVMGATAAGAAAAAEGESVPLGTGIGALAAAWGSFASTGARLSLGERGLPDTAVAILEGTIAVALCLAAIPSLARKIV